MALPNMRPLIIIVLLFATNAWAEEPRFVIGSQNPDLAEGARALLGGRNETGIRLTLKGLEVANTRKEEEAALSNLCAGYTNMGNYDEALKYCDILLQRNDRLWRPYNSKALIYISRKQYDKAEEALIKGEALNPDALSMKIARALFLDATVPVTPGIEIDDRKPENLE
jgi:tetratricopeptide (TPR) repeat protein